MSLIPANASAFFRTDTVTIHAQKVGADGTRREAVATCKAHVSDEGARVSPIGDLLDAHLVTVEIAAADWKHDIPLTEGGWIEAGPRWRELTIKEAPRVGELYQLTCSAKEGAPHGKA